MPPPGRVTLSRRPTDASGRPQLQSYPAMAHVLPAMKRPEILTVNSQAKNETHSNDQFDKVLQTMECRMSYSALTETR
jgi:hypothetical protein